MRGLGGQEALRRAPRADGPLVSSSRSAIAFWKIGSSPFIARRMRRPGHEQAVDLVRALEDAVDPGVAPVALGGVVLDVARAPEDLDVLVDDVVEHLGAPDLDHRALDVVLLDPLQGGLGVVEAHAGEVPVDHPGGAVDDRLGHVGEDRHLPDLVLDQAEARDGLAERGARVAVLGGGARRPASRPR